MRISFPDLVPVLLRPRVDVNLPVVLGQADPGRSPGGRHRRPGEGVGAGDGGGELPPPGAEAGALVRYGVLEPGGKGILWEKIIESQCKKVFCSTPEQGWFCIVFRLCFLVCYKTKTFTAEKH